MSRIDELITRHCSQGVEYKTFGELGTITRGKRFVKSDMVESGTPCIHYGELYTKYGTWATEAFSYLKPELASRLRYASPGDVIFVTAGETIEDIGKAVAWLGEEDVVTHDALYAFRSPLDPKYVAYFSQTHDFHNQIRRHISSAKISSISTKNLAKVRIPVPPLELQQEIVAVLDRFTKLEAELEAELEARRKQYQYYRDAMLSFDERMSGASKQASKQILRWATLESICMKTNNIKWREASDKDYSYIDLSSVDRSNNEITETQIINARNAPSRAQQIVLEDDVIFGTTRPTLRRFCHIPREYDGQICSTGFCVLRADKKQVLPKYLYFSITTAAFNDYVERTQKGAGYPAISDAEVKSFKIPIPSMAEQERIVAILDKFDALVNDLSAGLPAEIKARRQQYEYYRDRLLSFREAA